MAESVVAVAIERLVKRSLWLRLDSKTNQHLSQTEVFRLFDEADRVLWRLKPLLKDADSCARLGQDNTVCLWMAEIIDAAYNLEDSLFEFASKVASAKQHDHELEKVSAQVEGLLVRLSALTLDLEGHESLRNSVHDDVSRKMMERRKVESGFDRDDDVVGLDDDINKLVDVIVYRTTHVSISGMGGSGKTALARQIYHHPTIRNHFDRFAWIHVPYYDEEQVRTEITHLFRENTVRDYNLILDFDPRTYLIVLDDVRPHFWDHVQMPTDSNVVLVLTSRIKFQNSHSYFVHQVKCLDENKSWELFQKRANFSVDTTEDSENYNEMKEVGQSMLEDCAGLPLAITVLGNILCTKHTISEWKTLHKNIKVYARGGIVQQKEDILEYSYVLWVLGLSYDALPDYLKPCFLHLSQFRNGAAINVKELCQMWTAEGFAFKYDLNSYELCYLEKNNMIEVAKFDFKGRIKRIRLHNLMRELCLLKTREETFLQILNCGYTHEEIDSETRGAFFGVPTRKVHRIAINSSRDIALDLLPFIEGMDGRGNLRSLICFNTSPYPSYEQVMKSVVSRFHKLRVLKFENLGTSGYVGKLPEEIGELIHLRFLSLKGSHVEQLPSSISNLICLQTLDLRTNGILQLSDVMWKMEQLINLYLPQRCYIKGNRLRFSSKLTRIKTLVNIPAKHCDLNDLKIILSRVEKFRTSFNAQFLEEFNHDKLATCYTYLRSLGLENLDRSEIDIIPFILKCTVLEKLHVEGKMADLRIDNKYMVRRLTELNLSRSDLKHDPMPSLGKLNNLRSLYLDQDAFKGNKMVCSSGGFRRLETLSIIGLEQLKEWTVERESLPRLRCLVIEYCYHLEAIPDGLKWVTTLEKLVIKRMSTVFQMRVQEGGYDFFKVQQVTDIQLHN